MVKENKFYINNIENINKPINCLAFFPDSDSKRLVVGCKGKSEKLLLLTLDDDGNIKKEYQKLEGHSEAVNGIAISAKSMISVSNGAKTGTTILLREIDTKGEIKASKRLQVDDMTWIGKPCFNFDGTLLVCIGSKDKIEDFYYPWIYNCINHIVVWEFDKDGILKSEKPIIRKVPHMKQIWDISLMAGTQNCIIAGDSEDRLNERGLMLCDLSNMDNIIYKIIENYKKDCDSIVISPDAQIVIANDTIFAPQNDGSLMLIGSMENIGGKPTSFSADSNQIIFVPSIRLHYNIEIYTILTKEEKNILEKLKNLSVSQLLLIDKILDGKINLDTSKVILEEEPIPNEIVILLKQLNITLQEGAIEEQKQFLQQFLQRKKEAERQKEQEKLKQERKIDLQPPKQEITSLTQSEQQVASKKIEEQVPPAKQQSSQKEAPSVTSSIKDWANWVVKTFWSSSKDLTPKE